MGSYQTLALVLAVIASLLAGCAARPTAVVLDPVSIQHPAERQPSVLAVTNRARDKEGFTASWSGSVSYERYRFSIPPERTVTDIAYPTAKPDATQQFLVLKREPLNPDRFAAEAVQARDKAGTVAIFVHGYNTNYQEALFRTAQLAGDARTLSPPILFSWPSEGKALGYVADRDAAMTSRGDLDALLKLLGSDDKVKRIVLFAHSMGSFLSVETVRQLKLEGRSDVVGKIDLVLAAADIDVDLFRSQLRDIGTMKVPITLLVTKTDKALSLSSILGGERPRIGQLDIDDPAIKAAAKLENVRVIDISSLRSGDGFGHDRYADLARFGSEIARLERQPRKSGTFVISANDTDASARLYVAGGASQR